VVARSLAGGGQGCAACGHGMAPKDDQLGVAGASMSPGLAKMAARAAAAAPFAKAADLLADLAGIELTAKRFERSAEAGGTAAGAAIDAETDAILSRRVVPLPPAPLPDMLYIAIDGTGVPMIPAETDGRPGKATDGRARTREVKLACLFTQTSLDHDHRPVRDPASSTYLATLAPAEPFGELVAAEARRRGSEHIRQLVVLAAAAARALPPGRPEGPRTRQGWPTSRPTPTGCATPTSAASACSSAPARSRPAARPVIGQRLKLSGMRWSVPGAASIALLRCQQASGRWEQIWQRPHNQTTVA